MQHVRAAYLFFLPVKDFFHKLLTRFSLSRKAETPDAIRQRGAIF